MGTYGQQAMLEQVGQSVQACADGNPQMMIGGVTIDWSAVAALGSDTTYDDSVLAHAGDKVLRFGQVLCRENSGANSGQWGPYDVADSTTGRGTLRVGEVCIVNETVMMSDASPASNHPAVLVGGQVWYDRIIATTGTHSLAAGPTFTELQVAMPALVFKRV